MRRGTTPTFQFDVDMDLSGWDVYVSFGQYDEAIVTRNPPDLIEATEDGCTVTVKLTQKETLSFAAGVEAQAHIRACRHDGAVASGMWDFMVKPILLDGEIPMIVGQGADDGS